MSRLQSRDLDSIARAGLIIDSSKSSECSRRSPIDESTTVMLVRSSTAAKEAALERYLRELIPRARWSSKFLKTIGTEIERGGSERVVQAHCVEEIEEKRGSLT